MRKSVLIAGASGLVGAAATKHFCGEPDCDVVVVSRRPPNELSGARFVAADQLLKGAALNAVQIAELLPQRVMA